MRFGKPLLACALSFLMVFVSLVPCFAEWLPPSVEPFDTQYSGDVGTTTDYYPGFHMAVSNLTPLGYQVEGDWNYLIPVIGQRYAKGRAISSSGSWYTNATFWSYDDAMNSNVTWYFAWGLVNTVAGTNGFYVSDPDIDVYAWNQMGRQVSNANTVDPTYLGYATAQVNVVDENGSVWPSNSGLHMFRVDIKPNVSAGDALRSVNIITSDCGVSYNSSSSFAYYLPYSFAVPTTQYLDDYDAIVQNLISINSNVATYLPEIYQSLTLLTNRVIDIGGDVSSINLILTQLKELDTQALQVLTNLLTTAQSIDSVVQQIYATMVSEVAGASDLDSNAQAAIDEINTVDVQETAWQNQMSSNFTQLELDNFSLGILGSGLSLVGNMFTSIWSAFGGWSIMFTFPLVFGISLLVIGRISKSGGKGSSRDKDKGDDG